MSMEVIWLIVALAAGILEIIIPALVFLFVALAALLAVGVAWLGASLTVQIVFFAAASLLLLLLVRPFFASRRLSGRGVPSRTEALAGRLGHVTEAIDPVKGTGRVSVGGEDWAARSSSSLPAAAEVRVEGADGIVLIVSATGNEGGRP
jgi:membrane protein implicated in regulation of membrane protease activity